MQEAVTLAVTQPTENPSALESEGAVKRCQINSGGGGTRTPKGLRPPHFECGAATDTTDRHDPIAAVSSPSHAHRFSGSGRSETDRCTNSVTHPVTHPKTGSAHQLVLECVEPRPSETREGQVWLRLRRRYGAARVLRHAHAIARALRAHRELGGN